MKEVGLQPFYFLPADYTSRSKNVYFGARNEDFKIQSSLFTKSRPMAEGCRRAGKAITICDRYSKNTVGGCRFVIYWEE